VNKLADLPVVPVTVPHPRSFQIVDLDYGDGAVETHRLDLAGFIVHTTGRKPGPQWMPEQLHDAVMEWIQLGTDNARLDAIYEGRCETAEGTAWVSSYWRWTGAGWQKVDV